NKGGSKEGQCPKCTKGNSKSKGKGKDSKESKDSKASDKGKEKEKDEKSSDKANTTKDELPAEAWATMLDDTPDVPLILEYLNDCVILEFARGTHTEHAPFESPSPQTKLDNDGTSMDSSMHELSDLFDESDLNSDDKDMPNLQSVSDSESDDNEPDEATFNSSDEESDIGSDTDSDEFILFDYTDENDYEWESHVSDNDAVYKTSYTVEELTTPSTDAHIDLYDSGATCHMSGAKDRFKNLIPIEPKSITAADNRSFSATAKEKCSVTVERSIKFNFDEEILVDASTLPDVVNNVNPNSTTTNNPAMPHSPKTEAPTKATVENVDEDEDKESAEPTDHIPVDKFQPHCSSCIRTESDYVCRLREGVGLTSAHPSASLLPMGLQKANEEADHKVFVKKTGKDSLFLAVDIDNCLITGTSPSLIAAFKANMHKKYKLMDLGPVEWLLGIKVTHNRKECTISLSLLGMCSDIPHICLVDLSY
ncbi:hypothetical protein CVT25_014046, partial [Psilocybe cyanescens]